ncbi:MULTISPECIES: molecular chaperone DnaJ [unclassified Brevundimonas]|uniref:molecular chaperone DnaJ n=1 Tax=unclassified Brevundimonas TaxID=2622653 RepID=UPI0006F99867|nr:MULTISPECIES: molecular chaperone DnaJ [unclassified Brevundimonas]KQY95563.1 molecular chaperone DnaJ [Brevundimonas sp. Root1423]KRA28280.1 molecular chaperone DnaJ [Brevundimonas sp. Root608]
MATRDYYEVLEVERTIDAAGLKSAYRKLAMKHHPDRNGGCEDSMARFKEISEAYSVLSDDQKRAAYDRFGHAGVNGGGGFGGQGQGFTDVNDIFSQVFGEAFGDVFGGRAGGGARQHGPRRGSDLRYDLEITLEQAYKGADVEIAVPTTAACDTCEGTGAKAGTKPTTCTTCQGAGRVRSANGFFQVERTCPRCGGHGQMIAEPCTSCAGHGQVRRNRKLQLKVPAGVDDGSRIRLSGEGDAGMRGGPRGDLYVFLSVTPHELFERDNLDLLVTVPVPMTTAALGGEIDAPCLTSEACDGRCRAPVSVPAGSQTGKTVRIKGKGMPHLNGKNRGDLVVELFVETPTDLTPHQKELLQELAASLGESQTPRNSSFAGKAKRFWADILGSEAPQ